MFASPLRITHNWMMPRRTPIATAWVRSVAFSFSMMWLMWLLTVSSASESFGHIPIPIAGGHELEHFGLANGQSLITAVVGQLRRDLRTGCSSCRRARHGSRA